MVEQFPIFWNENTVPFPKLQTNKLNLDPVPVVSDFGTTSKLVPPIVKWQKTIFVINWQYCTLYSKLGNSETIFDWL